MHMDRSSSTPPATPTGHRHNRYTRSREARLALADNVAAERSLGGEIALLRLKLRDMVVSHDERLLARTLASLAHAVTAQRRIDAIGDPLGDLMASVAQEILDEPLTPDGDAPHDP